MVIFWRIRCLELQFGFLQNRCLQFETALKTSLSSWFTLISYFTHTLCHSLHFQSRMKLSTIPCALSPWWCCRPQEWGCHPGWLPKPLSQLRLWVRTLCYSSPWWCTFPLLPTCVCLSARLPALPPSLCARGACRSLFVSRQQQQHWQVVPSEELTEHAEAR